MQIRLRPDGKLCSRWFALTARLLLAASIAGFLFPTIYAAYDQWLAPIRVQHGFDRPRGEARMVETFVTFWILLTTAPAIIAVGIWYISAVRNARRIATGLTCSPVPALVQFLLPIYIIMLLPICILIVLYRNLNELWQASDPDELDDPESWKNAEPGWLVQTWGTSMLTSVGLGGITLLLYPFLFSVFTFHLASFNIAVTGVLLSIIIKSITERQHERYRQLFEEMPAK